MAQRTKRLLLTAAMAALLAVCLGLSAGPGAGEALPDGLRFRADGKDAEAWVQRVDGAAWLFLPAGTRLDRLVLRFDGGPIRFSTDSGWVLASSGEAFDFAALFPQAPADGRYAVTLSRDGEEAELTVMRSANVGSLFLSSPDGEHGRAWVEQDKDNRAQHGGAVLLDEAGDRVYAGLYKSLKGRGHASWSYPKRPYLLRLDERADLLENGEAASAWVLLANYNDETLVHNVMSFDLAAALELPYSPDSRPVDLYYDGEYRGSYQLCEKVELAPGRVDIPGLEEEIDRRNPDAAELPTAEAELPEGGRCRYVAGLAMPEDLSGGYLLELDMEGRADQERSWFRTSRGNHVVCKSPEHLGLEGLEYLWGLWQGFEDAVYAGGTDPATGKRWDEFVDAESLARCYLVMELAQDGDAFLTSTYFYKPPGEEKLYAGPVWDFDYAYGLFGSQDDGARLSSPEGLTAAMNSRFSIRLLSVPDFQREVQRVYERELYPLVKEVLLSGDGQARQGRLRTLTAYGAQCADSAAMDRVLWTRYVTGSYEQALEKCRAFLAARNEWLYAQVMGWTGEALPNERFVDVPEDAWYFDAVNFVEHEGLFVGVSETRFDPEGTMSRVMAAVVLHRLADAPEPAGPSGFADVPEGEWFAAAAAWAEQTGVAVNASGGRFDPYRDATREEFLAMLYRYAAAQGREPRAAPIPEGFADRDQASGWARDALGWAAENGFLEGMADTELAPARALRRGEAAALLQRFARWMGL